MKYSKYILIKRFNNSYNIVFLLSFLIIQNLFANENSIPNIIKPNFHFGFELSELMQNQFSNLGNKNYTFFFGQEFHSQTLKNFGYRVLAINAELSSQHLKDNPFIKGDRCNLEGNLTVGRLFLDYWHPTSTRFGFVSFQPVFSIGLGYNQNQIRKGELGLTLLHRTEPLLYYYASYSNRSYDLKGYTFDFGFRLQTKFWDIFFIEFPVVDVFFYLWQSRSTKENLEMTRIEFPEWGMVFLWINIGYKADL